LTGPDLIKVTAVGPVAGVPQVRTADGLLLDGLDWTVERAEVARWENGRLYAVREGETTVTGRWRGQEVRWRLEVKPALLLRFDEPPETLVVGERVSLTVHGHRGEEDVPAPDLRWSSSAPEILTVDAAGTLTAMAEGVAYVTAQGANGDAVVEIRVSGAR